MSRVVEQKTNLEGFPKAGELIEIHPMQELSLQDRRVFNVLIENAGPRIAEDAWHEAALFKLRGPTHESGDRVAASLRRLMTTLVEVPCRLHGLEAVRTTVLLAENIRTLDENDSRAVVRYKLTETMRQIVENSRYWGRIKGYICFALSSKYSLALYEAVCLRINLKSDFQDFSVADFRRLLDVPSGRLERFPDLNRFALRPAEREVNALSDFVVEITPLREGGLLRGKLNGFRLCWRRKTREEWAVVLGELGQSKIGRKARMRGMAPQATA